MTYTRSHNIYGSHEHEHGVIVPRSVIEAAKDLRFKPKEVDEDFEEKCEADVKRIEEAE